MIQSQLFPPHPHPQLSPHPFPPKSELPKIPPSPPHAHERIRIQRSTLQLQLPDPEIGLPPHPHPVAAKSLIVFPPGNKLYTIQICEITFLVTIIIVDFHGYCSII